MDYRNPDYNAIALARAQRLEKLQSDPKHIELAKAYYRTHIADFISDWGYTLDPRNSEVNRPSLIPFILFPRQREFVEWVVKKWKTRQDGICVKSRDMGVSWLCAGIAASFFVLYDEFVFGFGSRKEEYVDHPTPKSLFWKIKTFLEMLPVEFVGSEPIIKTHMRFERKEAKSYIVGEAGDNIGRGDRASIYCLDEAAFIEHQDKVDAALSQTSNCKIWVSTIAEPGDAFHQKIIGGKFDIFEFAWQDDPRKDIRWYAEQKKKYEHDPVLLAREIDRDYSASTGDSWITTDIIEAAQVLGPADIPIDIYNAKLILGVDAAHMGDDETVLSPRAGRIAFDQICFKKINGVRLAQEIIEYCDKSRIMVYAIVIELDGPGLSCYDTLMEHARYKDIVYGVHTSSTGGDRGSVNLRAQMYRRAKEWMCSPPCSVPTDIQFSVQLASVKYFYKGGLLQLKSKKEMRAEGFKSPDKADAFALTFAVNEDMLHLPAQYQTHQRIQVDPREHVVGY